MDKQKNLPAADNQPEPEKGPVYEKIVERKRIGNKVYTVEKIVDPAKEKKPWWKTVLKWGGIVVGVGGAIVGGLILLGKDEEDDVGEKVAEAIQEVVENHQD